MIVIRYFIMRAGHNDILHHHLLWRDVPWAHWTKWDGSDLKRERVLP
jgi:hypothetical protein